MSRHGPTFRSWATRFPVGGRDRVPRLPEGLAPLDRLLWKYKVSVRPGVSYPPAFIFHADDDPTVDPSHSTRIYLALREAKTPAELHIYKRGGHGFGIRDAKGPNSRWPELCGDWMRDIAVLR